MAKSQPVAGETVEYLIHIRRCIWNGNLFVGGLRLISAYSVAAWTVISRNSRSPAYVKDSSWAYRWDSELWWIVERKRSPGNPTNLRLID
ncbi:c41eaf21-0583-432f-9109-9b6f02234e25 [Sclerotinia trifoliorum]|uniref:C41eaf21-0583-432f-9109-9b6f02234e25 n=1 Tax=Sclerotinia trifoliorum TaxID=28548 RepID=A0A8H2VN02_9HELO|nr:c41eaf21-0583-432f-9109-9b6f02234e25 [Sclerotinia trifoliorum]